MLQTGCLCRTGVTSSAGLYTAVVCTSRVARELYSHEGDDGAHHDFDAFELANVAEAPANAEVVREHHALLLQGFGPGREEDP